MSPQAAEFARPVVPAASPGGQERAKNLLWAAGKLAGYGIGLGLDLGSRYASLRPVSRTTPGPSWTRGLHSRLGREMLLSQGLMSAARDLLGHAGIELILALLMADRIGGR